MVGGGPSALRGEYERGIVCRLEIVVVQVPSGQRVLREQLVIDLHDRLPQIAAVGDGVTEQPCSGFGRQWNQLVEDGPGQRVHAAEWDLFSGKRLVRNRIRY